jgi:hypothetical protein
MKQRKNINPSYNQQKMNKRTEENIYDVDSYTDKELYDILDLNSPTDRELEARIIFLIRKYDNMQNESANKLSLFFKQIHSHFFYTEDEDEDEDIKEEEEPQEENASTLTNKIEYINPFENPPLVLKKSQFLGKNNEKQVLREGLTDSKEDIVLTKTQDYTGGKTNPLLQQTIKRVISIDSQYRENKQDLPTSFVFNLSETLKDVVSLKLYSIQIPYTWYTISTHYGSNKFYLKGNVPGINDGFNDYDISINPGNYTTPNNLASAVNNSIKNLQTTYSDTSFGITALNYDDKTTKSTFVVDIKRQFNETSYYLQFETPDTRDVSSVSQIFGFTKNQYYFYKIYSKIFPTNLIDDENNNLFTVNQYNNKITIYKYIGPDNFDINTSIVELSFNISLPLSSGPQTRNQLITNLNNAISTNSFLTSSLIARVDNPNLTSYFTFSLKLNRYSTVNTPYSKIVLSFPNEPSFVNNIWTGTNSCFNFNNSYVEVNEIISENYAIPQTNNLFTLTSSPSILMTCQKPLFDVSTNNYSFSVAKTSGIGYTLLDYIDAINNGIRNTDNSYNGIFNSGFSTGTQASTNSQNYFNLNIDIIKPITQNKFNYYLDGYYDESNNLYYPNDFSFGSLGIGISDLSMHQIREIGFLNYFFTTSLSGDLSQNNGVITGNSTFSSIFSVNTKYMAVIKGKDNVDSVSSKLIYAIPSPPDSTTSKRWPNPVSITYSNLVSAVTNEFSNYTDNTRNLFNNTTFTSTTIGGKNTASLSILYRTFLTQKDYSIQFVDISSIIQTSFVLDSSGYVDNLNNYFQNIPATPQVYAPSVIQNPFLLDCSGYVDNLNMYYQNIPPTPQYYTLNGFNQLGISGEISIRSQGQNIIGSNFSLQNSYLFDSSYIALLRVNTNDISKSYPILSPPGDYRISQYSNQNSLLNGVITDIQNRFNRFTDLSVNIQPTSVNENTYFISLNIYVKTTPKYYTIGGFQQLGITGELTLTGQTTGSYFPLKDSYTFDSSYIAIIRINPANTNDISQYKSYFILSPSGDYRISSKYLDQTSLLDGVLTDIQNSFNSITDLSVNIQKNIIDTGYYITLKINIIQQVHLNNIHSSWKNNLDISSSMIDASYSCSINDSLIKQNVTYSTVLSYKPLDINPITINQNNNTITLVPFDSGVSSPDGANNIVITLTSGTSYSRDTLKDEINRQFSLNPLTYNSSLILTQSGTNTYSKFRIFVNKTYTAKDYNLVFYDQISFVKCYVGSTSVQNTTWDTTLGWILGFRTNTIYDLTETNNPIISVDGDTGVSTNLYNYFLLCLDDFNQNHLNDGLVTITGRDTSIPLPSYAATYANMVCDLKQNPGAATTNFINTTNNKLTQSQIFSAQQITANKYSSSDATSKMVSTKSYGSGPFIQDVFGIIPAKTAGLTSGASYIEFGGTLQNQERLYFGPVNIRRMKVQLVTDRGDVLDLNGANWSFSLICEQLYNNTTNKNQK